MNFGQPENKKKYQQYEFNSDFDINLYESFYRSHDPQLGRFWQVDPKPNENESPYVAMANNPILYSDILGDTARYYNQKGDLLLTIGGKGYNHATILNEGSEARVINYAKKYQKMLNEIGDKITNNKEIEAGWSKLGVTYDVGSFEKFYEDNKDVPATMLENDDMKYVKDVKFNGKPIKVTAEVYGDVVLDNGLVKVGPGKTTAGNFSIGFFDEIPRAKNSVSDIHTHPISVDGKLEYNYVRGGYNQSRSASMFAGPSWADKGHAGFNNNYRSIVVDSRSVYLHQGKGDPVIVIPRK